MPRRIWILQLSGWSLALAMMASGCAPLNSSKSSAGPLHSSRLPPDAVVFDVAFVRLKAADVESYDAIWSAADEQRLDALLRGALERNGVRAGVLGQQFPAKLPPRRE
jgi:hypothetical protein